VRSVRMRREARKNMSMKEPNMEWQLAACERQRRGKTRGGSGTCQLQAPQWQRRMVGTREWVGCESAVRRNSVRWGHVAVVSAVCAREEEKSREGQGRYV